MISFGSISEGISLNAEVNEVIDFLHRQIKPQT